MTYSGLNELNVRHVCKIFGQLDETRGIFLLFYVLDSEPPMTNQKWTRYFENSKKMASAIPNC